MARPRYTAYAPGAYDHTLEDTHNVFASIGLPFITGGFAEGERAKRAEQEKRAREALAFDELNNAHDDLDQLTGYTPSVDDLTARYRAVAEGGPAFELRNSQAGNARADADSIAAQKGALRQLGQIAESGGNDAIFRQGMQRALTQAGAQARGARMAAEQQFRSRGMGNGSQALLAALTANQSAAQQANQDSVNVAAEAQKRGLQALQGYGELAGQIRGASFGEQFNTGNARDEAIARYNQMAQSINARNADRQQQANRDEGVSKAQANQTRYGMRQGQYDRRQGIRNQYVGIQTGHGAQAAQQEQAARAAQTAYGQQLMDAVIGATTQAAGGFGGGGK